MKSVAVVVMAVSTVLAQSPVLATREVNELTLRAVQLAESVTIVIPDLPRAAEPILEQMRQARASLERTPGNPALSYAFLEQARKYHTLTEALPRPYPFPEAGSRQLSELRELVSKFDSHFRALLVQREALLRPADRDNLRRYAEANLKTPPPSPGLPRVVFFGDSITDGWRLNEYFPGKDYVNRGISGQVTSEMLARMKADVMNLRPQAMVILAGTNDLARGTDLVTIQNNLTMICDLADVAKIKVVLASVLPIHDYNQNVDPSFVRSGQRPPDKIRSLNNWARTFAANRGYTYLNYFDAMVDGGGFLRKELADDGLHPNAAGYRIMAPLVEESLRRVLPAAAPAKRK